MSYPLSERTPNGIPAQFILNDPQWLKLPARRKGYEDQDPQQPIALQSGLRAPERMEGDDPPIATPKPVDVSVNGQTPPQVDELTLAGLPMHRPRYANPQPVPDLERLGIPSDAIEVPKTPQFIGGRYVGSNVDYAPPAIRGNTPTETIAPRSIDMPAAPTYATNGADFTPIERPRSFDKLDPLSKIAMRMRPDPNQPITDKGASVETAEPINLPTISGRGYFGQGVSSPAGEETLRPTWSDPYDKAMSRDLAIRDVLANPSQLPKAHGWKRLLPVAERALQGIAATGSLAGGLGGAIEGGVETAVDPRSATKIEYQRKLRQADQNLSGMQAIRGAQIKQQGELADIGYKRAQTDEATARASSLRNPKPTTFKGADGLQYEYDATSHTAKPISGQGRARAKVLRTVERSGKVWYETDDGLQPALDPKTGKQLEEELVPVTLPGGATVKVKPATAAQLSSTFANRRATAAEQEAFKQYGASLKAVRDRNRLKERDYTQAVKAGEDFNKGHDDLDKMYADAQSLSEMIKNDVVERPEDMQKLSALNGQLPGLQARLNAEAERLSEQYGQHLRYNEQERFEPLSSGPELEDDPELPAINVGEGPQVGVSSAPQGRISRQNFGKFREQNPQFKDRSDAEIESMLKGQGYEIY